MIHRSSTYVIFLISLVVIASAGVVFENSTFLNGPVKVFDACTDANFTFAFPLIGRYNSSDLISVWAFDTGCNAPPNTLIATRKLINTTTLQVVEEDKFVDFNITCSSPPLYTYTANDYIGLACTSPDITYPSLLNIVVYNFLSTIEDSSGIQVAKITSNSQTTVDYEVLQLTFQDDYFYVTYTLANMDPPLNVYLQGFSVTNPNQMRFNTPVELQSNDKSGISKITCAKLMQNDSIICAWRENTQARVVYVMVQLASGVVGSEIVVATDVGSIYFYPSSIIVTDQYFVIFLDQVSNGMVEQFSILISTNQETMTLPFSLESGYNSANLSAAGYYFDGFFTIIRSSQYSNGYVLSTKESLQLYDNNGAPNGSELVLLEDGRVFQGLVLQDQSYWVLCLDTMMGDWNQGYLGKIFAKISDDLVATNLCAGFLLVTLLLLVNFIL